MDIIGNILNFVDDYVPFVGKDLSRYVICKLAKSTIARPRPLSLWSNVPKPTAPDQAGPVCDYVTWPGLTDRSFSGRHLPPAPQAYVDSLPANDPRAADWGQVTALFKRTAGATKRDRSSVLFGYFAQWFTDSFLRVDPVDRRRNTSNHEIDLCQIYGLTEATANLLRAHTDGLLATQTIGGEEYPDYLFELQGGQYVPKARYAALPYITNGLLEFILQDQGIDAANPRRGKIYATGLERGNSSIGYVCISIIFIREHNRLARALKAQNPGWDDERLFQTARLINLAQLLKIVIVDYINHIAGRKLFEFDNSFAEQENWYRTNWIALEFDMLYRWHGLVPDTVDINGTRYPPRDFRTNNGLLEQVGVQAALKGARQEQAGKITLGNTPDFLLPAEFQSLKMGRDFRVARFNDYRLRFGLDKLTSWDQLTSDKALKARLKALYGDIDQLELVVGLFAEEAKAPSLFGALMLTMVAEDAFTQALTNPLLSTHAYNRNTLTDYGLAQIDAMGSLHDLAMRNGCVAAGVTLSFDYP
jgi:prostaglandin-endoperoxide synthase 2